MARIDENQHADGVPPPKPALVAGKSRVRVDGVSRAFRLLSYVVMFFVIVVSVAPLLWVLLSSFKTNAEIVESALTLPMTPSFQGYFDASETANIPQRYLTSATVTSFATILALIIYSMASYALARFNFKLRNVCFAILISSMLLPVNAMVVPIYQTISSLGLLDTKTGLVLLYTGFQMALCLFIMRSFFLSIPKEIEESAYVEGAGYFRTFISIMLPIARPAVTSAAVLTFIYSWNDMLFAMLLTSSESNRTLPLTITLFTAMFSYDLRAMFSALVMCMIPNVILYLLLQRFIMQGLVAGAVKA